MTKMIVALTVLTAIGCAPKPTQEPLAALEIDDQTPLPSEASENKQPLPHQAEKEADRTITQQIRQQVFKEDAMSPDAKNVRIVTVDGVVTLRGPVQTEAERAEIDSVAKRIEGVKRVDNQLEIASR